MVHSEPCERISGAARRNAGSVAASCAGDQYAQAVLNRAARSGGPFDRRHNNCCRETSSPYFGFASKAVPLGSLSLIADANIQRALCSGCGEAAVECSMDRSAKGGCSAASAMCGVTSAEMKMAQKQAWTNWTIVRVPSTTSVLFASAQRRASRDHRSARTSRNVAYAVRLTENHPVQSRESCP